MAEFTAVLSPLRAFLPSGNVQVMEGVGWPSVTQERDTVLSNNTSFEEVETLTDGGTVKN